MYTSGNTFKSLLVIEWLGLTRHSRPVSSSSCLETGSCCAVQAVRTQSSCPAPWQLALKDCTVLGSDEHAVYSSDWETQEERTNGAPARPSRCPASMDSRHLGPSLSFAGTHDFYECTQDGGISQCGSHRLPQWMELDKPSIPKQESQLSVRKWDHRGPLARERIFIVITKPSIEMVRWNLEKNSMGKNFGIWENSPKMYHQEATHKRNKLDLTENKTYQQTMCTGHYDKQQTGRTVWKLRLWQSTDA